MTNHITPPTPGSPQRVTLPDSLIRAITLTAADHCGPPIAALEAAVLITFGYALYRRHGSVDPRQVTIPTAQWDTICQALMNVPANTALDRVNLGLDWVDLGPAADDHPVPVDGEHPVDGWRETPDHPVCVWQAQVAAGSTRLGYAAWVTAARTLAAAGGRSS